MFVKPKCVSGYLLRSWHVVGIQQGPEMGVVVITMRWGNQTVRRQTARDPYRADRLLSHGTQLTRAQFLSTLIMTYHQLGPRESPGGTGQK